MASHSGSTGTRGESGGLTRPDLGAVTATEAAVRVGETTEETPVFARLLRPSPALVVATIALFVALGGPGYAAGW
jgi:hypothetical protein